MPQSSRLGMTMPANGSRDQASPAQKKNAGLLLRSRCGSFFNRFCSGNLASTCGWVRGVARTPATMMIAAWASARFGGPVGAVAIIPAQDVRRMLVPAERWMTEPPALRLMGYWVARLIPIDRFRMVRLHGIIAL